MKALLKVSNSLLALVTLGMVLQPIAALAARDSGGGNGEKLKVFIVAQRALNSLRAHQDEFPEVRADDFKAALESTKISFTDASLILGGQAVDAINTPQDKTIMIQRAGWRKMRVQPTVQVSFIAHEILSLMQVEKTDDYRVSSKLASFVVSEPEPVFKWSCAAISMERGNPNSYEDVIGEGESAAEAWQDLLDSRRIYGILVKSLPVAHSPAIQVNMADACVKN
ncbi:MAG: hypothetical protein ACJ763_00630 [Bdellovibrionia bacterium]